MKLSDTKCKVDMNYIFKMATCDLGSKSSTGTLFQGELDHISDLIRCTSPKE